MQKPIQGVWRKRFLSAFILFHVCIMVLWGLPGSRFRARMTGWMEKYVVWTGLWHSWDMFSPDPLSLNFNVVAEITFKDGTIKQWELPRMEKLGIWERFQKERFRKWRERVRLDAYQVIWPDTCRWIARNHNNPGNPPTFVSLTRQWGTIPPPIPGKDYQPIPGGYDMPQKYLFYVHPVAAQDLQ